MLGTRDSACAPVQVALSLRFGTSNQEADPHGFAETARLDAFRSTCHPALPRVQAEPDG